MMFLSEGVLSEIRKAVRPHRHYMMCRGVLNYIHNIPMIGELQLHRIWYFSLLLMSHYDIIRTNTCVVYILIDKDILLRSYDELHCKSFIQVY